MRRTTPESNEAQIGGPGGIWLDREGDLVPPAAPQLTGTDPASPSLNGTPATDAAGNTSACSASISYTRLHVDPPPPPPAVCVVPKLTGKTLKAAKTALRAADCELGKVTRPKRPKGQKRWVLVVKASNPKAGKSPADGKVNLRLGPKPKKAHS